jgi:hypothetical protein
LVADEVDYNISGRVSKKAVDELVAAGNLEKLARLLANEDEDENQIIWHFIDRLIYIF